MDTELNTPEEFEVDVLRARVSELEERLLRLEGIRHLHRDQSMRAQLTCPACGHREIIFSKQVLDDGDGSTRKAMALRRGWLPWSRREGQFQVYICKACGLVEWRVDPNELAVEDKDLEVLKGGAPTEAEDGPYR